MNNVIDPISPEEAAAPEEILKRDRFGEELACAMADVTCEQHGLGVKSWHVSVEMREPASVRDRFFVTLDADGRRLCEVGPMSADLVDHLLYFVESGLEQKLPGSEAGSVSRKIVDRSQPSQPTGVV